MQARANLLASSTFRYTFIYAALFSVSVLCVLGFFYWSSAAHLAREVDLSIGKEFEEFTRQYRFGGSLRIRGEILRRVSRQKATDPYIYLLVDKHARYLAGNIDGWPENLLDDGSGWLEFAIHYQTRDGVEHTTARALAIKFSDGASLLVGRNVRELQTITHKITNAMIWSVALTLILSVSGGLLFSMHVLKRIENFHRTAREIMNGDLSKRVSRGNSNDDFAQLADSLNAMLDQIEDLMHGVKQVSDNIAHDLKTPLARLRNRLELARNQSSRKQLQATIENSIVDVDHLLETFIALLRIARIEGQDPKSLNPIQLNLLLEELVEFYEPLLEKKSLSVCKKIIASEVVKADRGLILQAIANLLDNAIKYSPPGGEITIILQKNKALACPEIIIADQGPGIPVEYHNKVWERFYRVDQSRSTPGNGLGLSLVEAVAKKHRLTIELADNQPGLRVLIRFPRE